MPDIVRNPPLLVTDTTTTATVTNASTYSDAFYNPGLWKGARFYVKRTADTGTCTLDTYLQAENPMIPGDWFDVTAAITAQFANDETGTYIGEVYPGITAQDTSADVTTTTTGAKVNQFSASLPWHWRLRYLHGGSSVTNTFKTTAEMLR